MKDMWLALQLEVRQLNDIQTVVDKLCRAGEDLIACLAVKPRYGFAAYQDVMELVRSQLTHREECSDLLVSPGPLEWLSQLRGVIEGWEALSLEDQELELEDINSDLEMHGGLLQNCLDDFDELMKAEAENEGRISAQVERALHNRLKASFAGRGP